MVLILAHGKPQASVGNMYGMSEWESLNSSHGNHASHIMARECGWHASTWECEWGMEVLQLWMKNMCGMWPLEGLGIPTLSMDMHVSMNELFTLNAFCKGNYAERVSEHLVWWYWDQWHVCIYGEVKFCHNTCRPYELKCVWVNELWHKIPDHTPHTQTQYSLCLCQCLSSNWIMLGLHGYLNPRLFSCGLTL